MRALLIAAGGLSARARMTDTRMVPDDFEKHAPAASPIENRGPVRERSVRCGTLCDWRGPGGGQGGGDMMIDTAIYALRPYNTLVRNAHV